jgi:hypothetical protein
MVVWGRILKSRDPGDRKQAIKLEGGWGEPGPQREVSAPLRTE